MKKSNEPKVSAIQKLNEAMPFALLILISPKIYYGFDSIAHAIAMLGIFALCGYRYYSMNQKKPDYATMFEEDLKEYKKMLDKTLEVTTKRHEKAMVHLESKVKELNENYGKVTMKNSLKREPNDFQF